MYRRVKLAFQLYKDTQAIHIRIGACWTQSEFAGQSSFLIDCFLSLERQREREADGKEERRRRTNVCVREREKKSDEMQRLLA